MMYAVRPQAGSLSASLANAVTFETRDEILDYVANNSKGSLDRGDLSLSSRTFRYDPRCGWRNWGYVLAKRVGKRGYQEPAAVAIFGEVNEDARAATNADRIRHMGDEELARTLICRKTDPVSGIIYITSEDFIFSTESEALQSEMDWLRQPA